MPFDLNSPFLIKRISSEGGYFYVRIAEKLKKKADAEAYFNPELAVEAKNRGIIWIYIFDREHTNPDSTYFCTYQSVSVSLSTQEK